MIVLITVLTRIIVNKSTDYAWTTFRFVFYHNINVKENVFIEREPKKTLRDTLTQAALSGLFIAGQRQISQSDCEIGRNYGKNCMLTVGKFKFFSYRTCSWIVQPLKKVSETSMASCQIICYTIIVLVCF